MANVAIIRAVFPPAEQGNAISVAYCESKLRSVISPPNSNGTFDHGVFQLNDGGTIAALGGTIALAMDPQWNIRAARRYEQAAGWGPWTCGRKLGLG